MTTKADVLAWLRAGGWTDCADAIEAAGQLEDDEGVEHHDIFDMPPTAPPRPWLSAYLYSIYAGLRYRFTGRNR